MENPKLALIPSGYKSGKVYSILPTDGVGDFDFSRNATATRVKSDGLIEAVTNNVPRLDYLNSDCPTLLLEPQRTNLVQYSEDFNSWGDSGITVTSNAIISPSGDLTADKLQSTANNWRKSEAYSVTNGAEYSVSIYAKLDTSTNTTSARIEIYKGASSVASTFNLSTGAISGSISNAFIEAVGNDWYRIGGTYISNGSTNIFYIYPSIGYSNAGTMFFWGAQAEQGSYPTSYIKTTGSILTRQKDICINGGDADLFNITDGTFFVDTTPFTREATDRITLSNNNYNNRILISKTNATQIQLIVVSGGSTVATRTTNIDYNQRNKIAITFKENEFKFYLNGSLIHTDTSGSVPTGLNDLSFKGIGSALYWSGKIQDTRVYDRVLTEAQAIELTTI